MTGFPANQVFVDTAESSAKKAAKDRKRKATEEAKDSRRRSNYSRNDNSIAACKAYSRHDNGIEPDDIINDVSLEEMKTSFFNTRVMVTKEKSDDIERDTQQQRESELWLIERTKRITASRVGGIVKMKKTIKRSRKLEEFLYSKFQGNEATRYGINIEETARQYYIYQQQRCYPGLRTQKVGLVISAENPWLAASPDDRVHDPDTLQPLGIAEYKNPFSARDLTLSEACDKVKTFCLERQEEMGQVTYKLKRGHDYYYQIQCQLYCCYVQWCDFVVQTKTCRTYT